MIPRRRATIKKRLIIFSFRLKRQDLNILKAVLEHRFAQNLVSHLAPERTSEKVQLLACNVSLSFDEFNKK